MSLVGRVLQLQLRGDKENPLQSNVVVDVEGDLEAAFDAVVARLKKSEGSEK